MSLKRLEQQLSEMRRLSSLPDAQLFATCDRSQWTPSEHLDHCVKVSSSVLRTIFNADAKPGRPLRLLGRVILFLGWIPRGRGKSPERLRGARVSREDLAAGLDAFAAQLTRVEASHLAATRGGIVPHPIFGGLTPHQAIRFIGIHTHHHLKIVQEIVEKK